MIHRRQMALTAVLVAAVLAAGPMLAGGAEAVGPEPADAEIQQLRRSVQQMQEDLDRLIDEARRLRQQAATGQIELAEPADPVLPAVVRPGERGQADLQWMLEMLERIDRRQQNLDDRLQQMEMRQRLLERQVDQAPGRVTVTEPSRDNPYAYHQAELQAAAPPAVPVQMRTTMQSALPAGAEGSLVYAHTGYGQGSAAVHSALVYRPMTTVVYTRRYVYPRVWQGRVYVVPDSWRHGHSWRPWWGRCGYYYGWPIGYRVYRRGSTSFGAGLHVHIGLD